MAEREKKLFKLIGTHKDESWVTRKCYKIDALIEAGNTKEEVKAKVGDIMRYFD